MYARVCMNERDRETEGDRHRERQRQGQGQRQRDAWKRKHEKKSVCMSKGIPEIQEILEVSLRVTDPCLTLGELSPGIGVLDAHTHNDSVVFRVSTAQI